MDDITPAGYPVGGHCGRVSCIAWSSDGEQLVSGSRDRIIRLWDSETMVTAVSDPNRHRHHFVRCMSFSPGGALSLTGSDDGSVRLWYAKREEVMVKKLWSSHSVVLSFEWTNDGRRLASGSADWSVLVYGIGTPRLKAACLLMNGVMKMLPNSTLCRMRHYARQKVMKKDAKKAR